MCLGLARYPVRLLDKYVETRLQTPWLAIYTLSFLQGGGLYRYGNVLLGVAFDNLVGNFQPVICFYTAYEKGGEMGRNVKREVGKEGESHNTSQSSLLPRFPEVTKAKEAG